MSDEPQLSPQEQMALAAHQKDVEQIVTLGRQNHGDGAFDEASQNLADAVGPNNITPLVAALKQFDRPHQVIMALGNDPDRLARLAKLPLARQITEIAKIEAEHAPLGHSRDTGAQPLWTRPHARANARIPDDVWRRGADDATDAQWFRVFDRRQAERAGRPHVSTEAQRWAERVSRGRR
jgi:hypothetical protein